jgi:hypothetical protein
MNTIKHTPAPWRIEQEPDLIAIKAFRLDNASDICALPDGKIDQANARLIATAPELLEELCNAREWLDELCGLIQFRRLDAACDWVEANAASIDGTLAATIEKAIGEPVMAA